jgi:hypothetical protein
MGLNIESRSQTREFFQPPLFDEPQNEKENVWEWCKPLIGKCLKYQDMYNIQDVEQNIINKKFQLWPHPSKESVFVTEIVTYPRLIGMNLLFCAGKYEQLEDMLPSIETMCKRIGGKRLWGGGRPGWARAAKNLGFKKENIISKEL